MFLAVAIVAMAAAAVGSDAAVVEHTFVVREVMMTHLCKVQSTIVVNEQLPGPAIEVIEGDTVVVHVINSMKQYGLTIHWHGVKQTLNCWADGVAMLTQCPIHPNKNQTYRFNVTGQIGTLWWHAHVSSLRVTVHGAFIIRPKLGASAYPFPKPDKEIPIIIGEWFALDPFVLGAHFAAGNLDDNPKSATINGKLGDLSNCSGVVEESFTMDVEYSKTYLLRMVNAALFSEFYFKVAGHTFTVIASDANYLKPFRTDIIAIAPGETIDFLMIADAPPGKYHMVALATQPPKPDPQVPISTSRGVVQYTHDSTPNHPPSPSPTPTPTMPDQHDTITSFYFHNNFTALHHPNRPQVPLRADEDLLITLALGTVCQPTKPLCIRGVYRDTWGKGTMPVATMNNVSFVLPTKTSLLEAYYNGIPGVYTEGFPNYPPVSFNFTDRTLIPFGPKEARFEPTSTQTKVKRFRYNATVDVVFQSTTLAQSDANPMHLHGYDFFVLAQGLGNYDPERDFKNFNLVDPPLKNTVLVPRVGWAAIRFVANNPGMWYLHCHFEFHMLKGMSTAFIVENGPALDMTLPPPPVEFPKCNYHERLFGSGMEMGAVAVNYSPE